MHTNFVHICFDCRYYIELGLHHLQLLLDTVEIIYLLSLRSNDDFGCLSAYKLFISFYFNMCIIFFNNISIIIIQSYCPIYNGSVSSFLFFFFFFPFLFFFILKLMYSCWIPCYHLPMEWDKKISNIRICTSE